MNLVHCSYHKCLTVYFKRVMHAVFNRCLPWHGGYRHYNSHLEDFRRGFVEDRVSSINNRALELDRLGDFRLSRFIRDPRDLVVSGYFYHRRGSEDWVTLEAPSADDWYFANAAVPRALASHGGSLAQYLTEVPEEEGLLAELELRRPHFESMARWPADDPRIATWRYEEILEDQAGALRALTEHYELTPLERRVADWFARRHALRRTTGDRHVRDPSPGQWRRHFTPRVRRAFDADYRGLVEQLGYPTD